MRSPNGLIIQGYFEKQTIICPEKPMTRKLFYPPESESPFEVSASSASN
jgi:hypothetical protein